MDDALKAASESQEAATPGPSILNQPCGPRGRRPSSLQRSTVVAAVSMACLAAVVSGTATYAVMADLWARDAAEQKWLPVRPPTTILDVGLDIIRMEACRAAWNFRVSKAIAAGSQSLAHAFMDEPSGSPFVLNNVPGTRYIYSSPALPGLDICGWYFIPPDYFLQEKGLAEAIAGAQTNAINMSLASFNAAASPITNLIPDDAYAYSADAAPTGLVFSLSVEDAMSEYEQNVHKEINNFLNPYTDTYGYTENTKEEKYSSRTADLSMPITRPPVELHLFNNGGGLHWDYEILASDRRNYDEDAWRIRVAVALDMSHFDLYGY